MRIGILGSGNMGLKLGDAFVETGHTVMIGTRNPAKLSSWIGKHGNTKASAGNFSEAASFGEVLVIATLWEVAATVIKSGGHRNFSGKVVIDVTNPLDFSKGRPRLAVGHTDSGAEGFQRMLPDSKVVKAFNIVGNSHVFRPDFPCGPPTMFICGNDEGAKKIVADILTSFGWESVDIGDIGAARLLEPLALLWINLFISTNSSGHAFKLLRK